MRNNAWLLLSATFVIACGGGTSGATGTVAGPKTKADSDSVAAATAAKNSAGAKLAAKAKAKAVKFDTAAAAGQRPLVRETYRYEGSSRDPFRALVVVAERGPELPDLRLVGLLYDAVDPNNSFATFRDIVSDKKYTVSVGQRIGRINVASMTDKEVKLRVDDLGTMREQTYTLRKSEDKP